MSEHFSFISDGWDTAIIVLVSFVVSYWTCSVLQGKRDAKKHQRFLEEKL